MSEVNPIGFRTAHKPILIQSKLTKQVLRCLIHQTFALKMVILFDTKRVTDLLPSDPGLVAFQLTVHGFLDWNKQTKTVRLDERNRKM
jgi:hypothetical protein